MNNYWKIRALAMLAAQAQDEATAALERYREALKAEGMDPSKPYRYDDKSETMFEQKTR